MPSRELVILDTCVYIDMTITSRPRHQLARELYKLLSQHRIGVRVPMHAMFEMRHATASALKLGGGTYCAFDLDMELVTIDGEFLAYYMFPDLPSLRAGDMIFVSLAIGDHLPLITEDKEMLSLRGYPGLRIYSAVEYMEVVTSRSP